MLSVVILSLGLAQPNPGESPGELANWIDARLAASWRGFAASGARSRRFSGRLKKATCSRIRT